jgi:ABC-type spermidine/putrescine transport system permease subunit II
LIFAITETVTWIRVEKPTFDLIGVVLGSLALAAALVSLALVLGLVFALVLIRRDRHPGAPSLEALSLHIDRPAHLS